MLQGFVGAILDHVLEGQAEVRKEKALPSPYAAGNALLKGVLATPQVRGCSRLLQDPSWLLYLDSTQGVVGGRQYAGSSKLLFVDGPKPTPPLDPGNSVL